jgi:hypothetical protein
MAEPTNREIVDRYVRALPADFETLGALRHPDFVEEWPQSGERIRGHEEWVKVHAAYPGGLPQGRARRILGSEDRWVLTPGFLPQRIVGMGDAYTVENDHVYRDGQLVHSVQIIELRDGKVWRVTTYWAAEIEAPHWRSAWVERMEEGSPDGP